MKIINIEYISKIYHVTIEPSFIAKLFGAKTRVEKFKDSGRIYFFGGATVYNTENGSELYDSKIGNAIDKWRRRF